MTVQPAPHANAVEEPEWLVEWLTRSLRQEAALARFDTLAGLSLEDLGGEWRGVTLPTGHPLDGLLERLGWFGKRCESEGKVHPLLFRSPTGAIVSLDPAPLPLGVAIRWPGLAGSRVARRAFSGLIPILRTEKPTARLRRLPFRGVASAAMVYDLKPITDHFRRIDAGRIIGLMEARDMVPYFFLLYREPPTK